MAVETILSVRHDPESDALFFHMREGHPFEAVEFGAPYVDAYLHLDEEGRVLALEVLSTEEFKELISRHGGTLDIPSLIPDPEHFQAKLAEA